MLAGDGAGELTGAGVRFGRAEHPICGDVMEITVRFDGDLIADLAWRADGCPATLAVAAAAREALCGVTLVDAEPRLRSRLQALGGLGAHEQHAERMLLRALLGSK